MTSNYMPDVVVEIAFNAGYTTPAASRTWTDVSTYVELADRITIGFGRQDERSAADANTLTLTLDNSDGRFTAGRSASPYYPNVRIGRPIRVKVTPPGGATVTRFVGFVDEWPVEWDGSDTYARATIRAASRLARLGLSTKLRSMPEEEVVAFRPVAYWTLGDPEGSTTATESSGNAAAELASYTPSGGGDYPVVFGEATGPGFDGLTAAQFAGDDGGSLVGDYLRASVSLPAGPRTIRASVRLTATYFGAGIVTTGRFGVGISGAGVLEGAVTTGPSIDDGLTHDVALVHDGVNEIMYLDGVVVDFNADASPDVFGSVAVGASLSGVIAHVAVYDRALFPDEIARQALVILQGAVGERTDQRVTRILQWLGLGVAEVATDTGAESMTWQQTSGQSAVDALRECESTEGGVLFDGRNGRVTFHNRSRRYTATPAATLDMASQHVGSDFAPKLDRSALTNDVTVENPTTGQQARLTSAESVDEYGVASSSARSLATTSGALEQKASWLVASYAEPRTRVPSLTVDVLAHQGLTPSAQTLLGLDVGSLLAVTNAPTQADTTDQSYFVEGYTETIGPESYEITFNLSPTYPTLNTVVLDDPVRGVLDGGMVLGL